jgi:molybdopterin synthase catalytic subunit
MFDIQLSELPLNPDICTSFCEDAAAGGTVVFIGTVRNQTAGKAVLYLDFEAYAPMAVAEMTRLAEEAHQRWGALKVSIHHRTGRVDINGIAVVIAVATPHRQAAFEACQFIIDTLKQTVPIWKKEVFEDGEVWVAAHP